LKEKKKRLNPLILIRYILAQALVLVLYTPLLLVPIRFHFSFLYDFIIILYLWAAKIISIDLTKNFKTPRKHVIYASNHKCHADPMIIARHLKDRFTFVMAQKLMRGPFKIIKLKMRLLTIDTRSLAKLEKSIKEISKTINRYNYSLVFFPEGKYILDEPVGAIKSGIIKLAKDTDSEVVPVAIYGISQDYIYDRPIVKKKSYIKMGSPINCKNFSTDEEFVGCLRNEIKRLYLELQEEVNNIQNNGCYVTTNFS
jgi:1-acyl-sn-glycerol-3-phosphate acyltransferase